MLSLGLFIGISEVILLNRSQPPSIYVTTQLMMIFSSHLLIFSPAIGECDLKGNILKFALEISRSKRCDCIIMRIASCTVKREGGDMLTFYESAD
jgi:hypothetical protein